LREKDTGGRLPCGEGGGKSVLSGRLMMLADMVSPGNRLVDVGCDHGFLSIYLVRAGICPRALAMDVRKGPLAGAKEHIEESGLGDYIEARLSDGLAAYRPGEADTLVCAGMGGRLMEKILTEGMDKARQMRELILQPQSELREFRAFLRRAGFAVAEEDAVCEDGKYYFAMKAVPAVAGDAEERSGGEEASAGGMKIAAVPDGLAGTAKADGLDEAAAGGTNQVLYDTYGEKLLTGRHPVLLEYLVQRLGYLRCLQARLTELSPEKGRRRIEEIGRELEEVGAALEFFGQLPCYTA